MDEYIREQIDKKLFIIKETSLKKRLIREIYNLIKNCDFNFDSINICENEDTLQDIKNFPYKLNIYNNNTLYNIIIPNSYPFRPPKLFLNYKPYMSFLRFKDNNYQALLYKYKKINCFCCDTMMCADNWSVHFGINNIINEVNTYKSFCREISHRIIIDVIKRKYLISDVNLVEWLY